MESVKASNGYTVIQLSSYTDEDIAASGGRLSRCRHCGGDCFYLEIFEGSRVWWHEVQEADYECRAEPLPNVRRVTAVTLKDGGSDESINESQR